MRGWCGEGLENMEMDWTPLISFLINIKKCERPMREDKLKAGQVWKFDGTTGKQERYAGLRKLIIVKKLRGRHMLSCGCLLLPNQ